MTTGPTLTQTDAATAVAAPGTAALAARPEALLLDFGGVVFETAKRPQGPAEAAAMLQEVLARAGHRVEAESLLSSLEAGLIALKHWKHAMSRTGKPIELTHRQLWEEYLLADQSAAVRATAAGNGRELMAAVNPMMSDHRVRPGIPELLRMARELGIGVGIVSNAHSGLAHRRLMRRFGLDDLVAVQLYSDELGIRKPHPEMIGRAAAALGTAPDRCWYVGDTQDRDVQAGRRAGVGAAVLTRSKHTDTPPFPVADRADAVFDTPEGLVEALAASGPRPEPQAPARTPKARSDEPEALLLDQGGVLVTSKKTPGALARFGDRTAARLRAAGHGVPDLLMADALEHARLAHQAEKAEPGDGPEWPEIDPARFWGELVGSHLPGSARQWLLAEAEDLTYEYAQAKSRSRLRGGVVELLEWCRDRGLPVAIVSNTICGRAARKRLSDAGIAELIGAWAYSDEVGRRKPDPALVLSATAALGVDPAECWFVGDKPWRDVRAARSAGVGRILIVRHGAPETADLERGIEADRPDQLCESMTSVHDALKAALSV
ncbi:HAD family hydrolase [Glycomyces salinus]|uniref:HAD family hydrolase n=1 Tax=Glycomyces salinus TaxID=980294 RepID=UPI0018EA4B60|nr:HAD-IA family hydrolase [Glycomyces salinus]